MIYIKKMLYARKVAREVNKAFEGETRDQDVLDLVKECTMRLPKELLRQGNQAGDLTDQIPIQVYVQAAIREMGEDMQGTVDRILSRYSEEELKENQQDVNTFIKACRELQEISALLVDDESLAS